MRLVAVLFLLQIGLFANSQEIVEYDRSFVSNRLGGIVEDSTGAAIPGARVDLVDCGSDLRRTKVLRSTVTAANGRFRFSRHWFSPECCLQITKDGFDHVRFSMILRKSHGEMHIKLIPAA